MHTCVSYIKWLKTPLKSLNSDSNRSHGDLPSRQITMYFLYCLSMKLHFPRNLASVREETENINACFYLKILVFFYCFFFVPSTWFYDVLYFTLMKKNRFTLSFWRPYIKLSAASLVIITWHISRSLFIHRSSNLLKRV